MAFSKERERDDDRADTVRTVEVMVSLANSLDNNVQFTNMTLNVMKAMSKDIYCKTSTDREKLIISVTEGGIVDRRTNSWHIFK